LKKVAIYGGSFNPIHIGHLITAAYVREICGLDKIIFIPCYISPHKTDTTPVDGIKRLEMIKSAISNNPYFGVSDYELKKGGVSYTIDTVKYLKNKFSKIDLIIGYDNLLVFDTWKEPDELVKLVNLIVLKRNTATKGTKKKNKYFNSAQIINTPIIDVSSSEIRGRIQTGKSINYLVPDSVKQYIISHKLYRD
jgi:nicotinate-nucleotide adenylyltransferase